MHVGDIAPQGGVFLGGSKPQIVIENPRSIDGVETVDIFPLYERARYDRR